MRLLRELSRRKLRTALTIAGITIGIWALVVFSSMANRINDLVGQGAEFYNDKIIVTDGEAFGTSPMRLVAADAIAKLEGVGAVDPQVQLLWAADGSGANFAVPSMVIGLIPGADAGYTHSSDARSGGSTVSRSASWPWFSRAWSWHFNHDAES